MKNIFWTFWTGKKSFLSESPVETNSCILLLLHDTSYVVPLNLSQKQLCGALLFDQVILIVCALHEHLDNTKHIVKVQTMSAECNLINCWFDDWIDYTWSLLFQYYIGFLFYVEG